MIARVGLAVCLATTFSWGSFSGLAQARGAERTAPGQSVYEKVGPMVFKVKTAVSADSPKASYGTGFAVAREGLLVTNYHVVSDAVLTPRLNKIFLVIGEESVPARIMGVDVIHDLALIKVDRELSSWLKFAASLPRQGQSIYSIGEPEDLNMSIVVGTYNGELKYGPYAVIHMSSPINSGMSGGPTVNGSGEIVGVNVSKFAMSNNISFAVPARFAEALLARARNHPAPANDRLYAEIGEQLGSVQDELTRDLLAAAEKTKPFAAWSFLQPSGILKCWSRKEEDDEDGKYESVRQSCEIPHSSYISSGLQTGTYSIELDALDGKKLGALPFYTLLNSRFDNGAGFEGVFNLMDSGPALLTRQHCFSDIVNNDAGVKFKMSYCARGYVKFKDLRNATISVATIGKPPRALTMELTLKGFTHANIKKILGRALNSIGTSQP